MDVSMSELRDLVTERVKNYPNLDDLVAKGAIVKKGTWYEILSKDGFDALIQYTTAVRVEGKKTALKVPKQSKSLQKLAARMAGQ